MAGGDNHRQVIGWREWVALPDLGVRTIKAKVDTGARSSSLHAWDVEEIPSGDGRSVLRFSIHPFQDDDATTIEAEAPLLEYRDIRSSSGEQDLRPVITTRLRLMGRRRRIELTLTNRDEMGFRMLLGRSAVRRRFVVDPGRSFIGGGDTVTPPRRAGARP
ncbi:MAG: ATP-dependent zinc protease family protein [Acidimicrobiales bacterium]